MTQAEIEQAEQEEEKFFRLFRSQIRECLHALLRHPRFSIFTKPVDTKKYSDYLEHVKKPMCLEDMIAQNNEEKYEDVESVRADFQLIVKNARTYNPEDALRVLSYASEFEDAALLKLECLDEELVKEWDHLRTLRDARERFLASREKEREKERLAKSRRAVPAPRPGARVSARLTGAPATAPTGTDALPASVAGKLEAAAKKLTQRARKPIVPATLALIAGITEATEAFSQRLERFTYWMFQNKQEHVPLSAVDGDSLRRFEQAAEEFCTRVASVK